VQGLVLLVVGMAEGVVTGGGGGGGGGALVEQGTSSVWVSMTVWLTTWVYQDVCQTVLAGAHSWVPPQPSLWRVMGKHLV